MRRVTARIHHCSDPIGRTGGASYPHLPSVPVKPHLPAQRAVIEGSPPGRPRAGLIAGVATPAEFEARRRALTGVVAPAHEAIWRQGGAAGDPVG